jgi:serine/threonine protein phosphatase PrpC
MKVRVGASSDLGLIRTNNEDGYLILPSLVAVADGMGGMEAGEVASGVALDTISRLTTESNGHVDLAESVQQANHAVFERASSEPALNGMGTTLTALAINDREITLVHVGDSRAYLLRDGVLSRLTEDHTRVQRMVNQGMLTPSQAAVHPDRNVLSRAVGVREDVQADERSVEVLPNDRIMLCTDGLHGMVGEEQIAEILRTTSDPQAASKRLIEAANAGGGVDNVTAVVVDVVGVPAHVRRGTPTATTSVLDTGKIPVPAPRGRRLITILVVAGAVVAILAIVLLLLHPFRSTTPRPNVSSKAPANNRGNSLRKEAQDFADGLGQVGAFQSPLLTQRFQEVISRTRNGTTVDMDPLRSRVAKINSQLDGISLPADASPLLQEAQALFRASMAVYGDVAGLVILAPQTNSEASCGDELNEAGTLLRTADDLFSKAFGVLADAGAIVPGGLSSLPVSSPPTATGGSCKLPVNRKGGSKQSGVPVNS